MKETCDYLKANISIGEANKFTIKELSGILASFKSFVPELKKSESREHFRREYPLHSRTLDSLILWNICLCQIMLQNCPEFLDDTDLTNKGYFTHLQIALTNNLISIKYLHEKGLDTQAKVIYRNSIELSDLALCILWDKTYFETHKKPINEKKNNPFVTPKNRTVSQYAEMIIRTLDGDKDKEAVDTMKLFWMRTRHEQYALLSEIAHGNFYHNIINTFKHAKGGNFQPALGWGLWLDLEDDLSDLCLHQISVKRQFTRVLKLKHDIDLFDNSNVLHKFIYFMDMIIGKKFMFGIMKSQMQDPNATEKLLKKNGLID